MDRTNFFNAVRGTVFRPSLSQGQVDGCNAVLDAMDGDPLAFTAYALATAYLETAHTMQPVNEIGGDGYFFRMYDPQGNRPDVAAELGNTQPGDGALFHGRGYVQLTGRALYARAGSKIGIDLIGNPDLALVPVNAAKVMRSGMDGGWFTGRDFGSYLPSGGRADVNAFTQARRIINGLDQAATIAGYALEFQTALLA
jgi:putative chitinase